jgi:predicted RND superfamily exporter protein
MSANRGDQESIMRRGCFISGVVTVIVLVVLRRVLFRLPPLGMLVLAGLLWVGFFVFMLRRGGNRRVE